MKWLLIVSMLFFISCKEEEVKPETPSAPAQTEEPVIVESPHTSIPPVASETVEAIASKKCDMKIESLVICADGKCKEPKTIKLPITGKVVLESHLATKEDSFSGGRLFPNSSSEGIDSHLKKSCEALTKLIPKADCKKAYENKYVKVWTPPENGKAGQGSRGDMKPSLLEEMFTCNMMWAKSSRPKAGEKWLATYQGKSVVVVMGYETGPGDTARWVGGCQGEVFYALGAPHQTTLTLGRLTDQSLNIGPVACN